MRKTRSPLFSAAASVRVCRADIDLKGNTGLPMATAKAGMAEAGLVSRAL